MHNPFKSLEKDPAVRSRLKKRAPKAGPATTVAPAAGGNPASEEDLFLHAFSDVEPLTKRGRDIA